MSFRAAPWAPGPHAQTVLASLWPAPRGPAPRRERWELPDGDFLDVDRHGPEDAPAVIALHGLEGSSRAPYLLRLAAALRARGLATVAPCFRGCSGEPNRLPRLYHSGETGDLDHAVQRVARERPGRPLGVAGFSLGGNVAACWMGEGGDRLPEAVRAGAVVSAPFDLARSAAALDGPGLWAFVYRERFLRLLRAKAAEKAHRHPGLFDAAAAARARSFAAFDEAVTAPLHGFSGARDYWERCSSGRSLGGVRRPLLWLLADDDPMVPADTIARSPGPAVRLEVTRGGGHVGFVEGPPWAPRFFAEERAAAFLAERLLA